MFGRTTCFCYAYEDKSRRAFERLKAGDVSSPLPRNGKVELREAVTNVPLRYWILCINMYPGPWLDIVDVSNRHEGTHEKFESESREIDSFST